LIDEDVCLFVMHLTIPSVTKIKDRASNEWDIVNGHPLPVIWIAMPFCFCLTDLKKKVWYDVRNVLE
jgi:hypothetical protein